MTALLPRLTFPIRLMGGGMRHWHILAIVVAVLLSGGPGAELLCVQEVEPLESSEPIEECAAPTQMIASRRSSFCHESWTGAFICADSNPRLQPRVRASRASPRFALAGHRLAYDLCAPLLC